MTNLHEQGIDKNKIKIMHFLCSLKPICIVFKTLYQLAVGLQKILSLLESEDPNICMHAVKVVANLAAEGDCFSLQTLFISLFSDIHSS